MPFQRTYDAVADDDGAWAVQIDGTYATDSEGRRSPHYGPLNLSIASTGQPTLVIRHVLQGDVIICAGDEQIAVPLSSAKPAITPDPAVLAAVSRFKTSWTRGVVSVSTAARWQRGDAGIGQFSAFCFAMAASLHALNPAGNGPGNTTKGATMPIGLIEVTAAGSMAADWLAGQPLFESLVQPLAGACMLFNLQSTQSYLFLASHSPPPKADIDYQEDPPPPHTPPPPPPPPPDQRDQRDQRDKRVYLLQRP